MAAPAVGTTGSGAVQSPAMPVPTQQTSSAGGIGSTPNTLQTSQEQGSSCSWITTPVKWVWETVKSIFSKIFGFIFSCCRSNNSSNIATTQDIINHHAVRVGSAEATLSEKVESMHILASHQLQEGDTVTEEVLCKVAVESFNMLPVNVRTMLGGDTFVNAPRSPENQKVVADYLNGLPTVMFGKFQVLLSSQSLGERLRGLVLMTGMTTLVCEIDGLKDEVTAEVKNKTVMDAFKALPEALRNLAPNFEATPTVANLGALQNLPDVQIEFAKEMFKRAADQNAKANLVHAVATRIQPHADKEVSTLTVAQISEAAYGLFMQLEEATQTAVFKAIGALDTRHADEAAQVDAGRRAVADFGHPQVITGLHNWINA